MLNDNIDAPVQTIIGKSLGECKEKLFGLYGSSYTITDYRQILQGGFLGLFQKEAVEASYVIKQKIESKKLNSFSSKLPLDDDTWNKNRLEILRNTSTSFNSTKQMAVLEKKLDQLSSKMDTISSSKSEIKSESIENIERMLEENEFTKDYIKKIVEKIRSEFSLDELNDFKLVEKKVIDWIGESIQIAPKKAFRPPHVIVIVGPTGVGKTTTVAKLAAQNIIAAKNKNISIPKIRMITIDRTRVAAEEQLKHYGDVMSIPVDKAEKAEDVKKLYEECKETCDVVLIDTSGYSPNDSESIAKMKTILSVDNLNPDVYLAVTASTKARDLVNIIQNYELFGFSSVIITKCDETNQYGNVISILNEKHKPIAYITDGQGPARNIKRPEIKDFLIRLNSFEVDRELIDEVFGEK